MNYRLERLQVSLEEEKVEGLIISGLVNIEYLSGFRGSAGVCLVRGWDAHLWVDFRYIWQAGEEVKGFEVHRAPKELMGALCQFIKDEKMGGVGFEAEHLSYHSYLDLRKRLKGIKLVKTRGLVERLRMVKDDSELGFIKRAVQFADVAFGYIVEFIKPGVVERDLALEIDYFLRKQGAEDIAFDTIVVSGERGALVHGKPSGKAIRSGELVILDIGAKYFGYCSDLTRTVVVGEPSAEQREVYEVVLEARRRAMGTVQAGKKCLEVDKAARDFIAGCGYGEYFGHGLGHGVGKEVHEAPRVRAGEEEILRPGMVITVEPGIYRRGWGGVRVEDMVVVKEDGCEVLNQASRELIVL